VVEGVGLVASGFQFFTRLDSVFAEDSYVPLLLLRQVAIGDFSFPFLLNYY